MTKRSASYDIDPLTYEEKERADQDDNHYAPDAPQIKKRTIYKFKRDAEGVQLAPRPKPDLKIEAFLGSAPEKGLFASSKSDYSDYPPSSIFKMAASGISRTPNLFASMFAAGSEKQSQGEITKLKQGQPEELKPPSIFSTSGPNSNNKSIFESMGGIGKSLFSNPNASFFSKNNFAFPTAATQPQNNLFSKQKKDEEDEDGDSAQLQQKQKMESDPSKSTAKFDYGDQSTLLKSVKLLKFKKDKGELLECPLTALILHEQSKDMYYLSVELTATHKNIFTGLLLKGKSAVKTLNNKPQNLQVLAFKVEPNQKKLESHVLKLQVSTQSNSGEETQFLQVLTQIIEGKEVGKKQQNK